jgi:membrane-associated phospholipid phosphatase
MTPFEWLALIYFVLMPLAAARHARSRGWLYALGAIALVIVARFTMPWPARAWMTHAYLVLGYWIPAAFTPGINPVFEQWLARADARFVAPKGLPPKGGSYGIDGGSYGINGASDGINGASDGIDGASYGIDGASDGIDGAIDGIDGAIDGIDSGSYGTAGGSYRRMFHHGFEIAYLLCYPTIPAAFAVVFVAGGREDITRFWIAVLIAGYACYGSLPWTAARPPRLISAPDPIFFARVNAHVLGRVSHNMNTFPSGHVAVTLAAALGVCSVSMAWGLAFLALAMAVAVAAVRGRYHYLVDVLVGAGVGVVAFVTAAVAAPAAGSGPGLA